MLLAAQPVDDAFHLAAREFFIFAEGGHTVVLFAVETFVLGIMHDTEHPFARTVAGQIRRGIFISIPTAQRVAIGAADLIKQLAPLLNGFAIF